jgi:hypothetical protein
LKVLQFFTAFKHLKSIDIPDTVLKQLRDAKKKEKKRLSNLAYRQSKKSPSESLTESTTSLNSQEKSHNKRQKLEKVY